MRFTFSRSAGAICILTQAVVFSAFWAIEGRCAAVAKPPNIVIILADDIGYGDFGCYGATAIKTPSVDRLAREGVRMTDAHSSAAVCTPTRYALITGQYAWRNPAADHILDGEAPLAIDPKTITLPRLLKQAGYATGLVGKWHIGLGQGDLDFNREIRPGPPELGFDYAFFFPATGDRTPCVFIENHRVVGLDPRDPIQVSYSHKVGDEPTGREHPELLTMRAAYGHDGTIINGIGRIGFMSGGLAARWKDEQMAETLTDKAVRFIEGNKDRPFFLYFATHDIHVPRVPGPRLRGTSGCGVRGDVVQEFDASVAAVLATLDRLHLADNTLVIVSSDNGGIVEDGYVDGSAAKVDGHRCNGPLRGFKGDLWEGGHREPLVARWPGRIRPGSTSHQLICLVDMLATLAAVAGRSVPPAAGPDSFNVLPAFLGTCGEKPLRDHLVVQSYSSQRLAIRQGPWKFIPASGPPGGKRRPAGGAQLYNLADDLGETKNLAAANPEKAAELAALLAKIRRDGRSAPR
jgi:arylsulfatase A-like enzyme